MTGVCAASFLARDLSRPAARPVCDLDEVRVLVLLRGVAALHPGYLHVRGQLRGELGLVG